MTTILGLLFQFQDGHLTERCRRFEGRPDLPGESIILKGNARRVQEDANRFGAAGDIKIEEFHFDFDGQILLVGSGRHNHYRDKKEAME